MSSFCKSCILPSKSGQDELPLASNPHHTADKQLVPIVEPSLLHIVLIGLDHVLGVEAFQNRHLITSVTTLLRHRFNGLLHLQCFELVLELMEHLLRALKSDNRTVASSSNSSSEITGLSCAVVIVNAILNRHL